MYQKNKKLKEIGHENTVTMFFLIRDGKVVDRMAYDYRKLNGKIIEKCGTQSNFARQMDLSNRTISLKLNNKISWKQTEIQKAMNILDLSNEDIQTYFFTLIVQ